jgi:glycosyltransferase involved in cell wall biosynthesis
LANPFVAISGGHLRSAALDIADMKILMIAPQPFFTPRGTPFSVYYRMQSLSQMGYAVDLATYAIGRDVEIPNVRIYRIPKIPGISNIKIGPSFPKLILDFFLFWKCLGLLITRRYDVVHAHEEAVFFCLVYKMLFPSLHVIYDMHSSLPQQLKNFSFSGSPWLRDIFAFLEKKSIEISDAVITICPELETIVKKMDVKSPTILIENTLCGPVHFADEMEQKTAGPVNWQSIEGRPVVLYTGTFEAYQGLPLLIEGAGCVARQKPEVVFVIVGGSPEQVREVKDQASSLGLDANIIFTGNLSPNIAKSYIRQADILVSPRIKGSNTPLKIYEYLASGKPIVATRHPSHTQILTEREAVLVECNAESMAQGILKALNDAQLSEAIGQNARKLYETRYGWDQYFNRLDRVLSYVSNGKAVQS